MSSILVQDRRQPRVPQTDIHQSQLLSMWAIIEAAVSGVLPLPPIIFIMMMAIGERVAGGGGVVAAWRSVR